MVNQIKIGEQVDNGQVEQNNMPPPIFPNAVIHCDENHCISSIGGAGHDSSFG
jgi:hypothetical protein